jgi:hypothetical protein
MTFLLFHSCRKHKIMRLPKKLLSMCNMQSTFQRSSMRVKVVKNSIHTCYTWGPVQHLIVVVNVTWWTLSASPLQPAVCDPTRCFRPPELHVSHMQTDLHLTTATRCCMGPQVQCVCIDVFPYQSLKLFKTRRRMCTYRWRARRFQPADCRYHMPCCPWFSSMTRLLCTTCFLVALPTEELHSRWHRIYAFKQTLMLVMKKLCLIVVVCISLKNQTFPVQCKRSLPPVNLVG